MVRYTKQRDKYRCGPVAILNALRWASGRKIPYEKYVPQLHRACRCETPNGTLPSDFDRAIRKIGEGIFGVRRVYHPSLGEIEGHLREGGILVLNHRWRRDEKNRWLWLKSQMDDDENRHYYLVVGVSPSGKSFYTVNGFRSGTALRRVSRERFRTDDLRFQRCDPQLKAWFLTKRE